MEEPKSKAASEIEDDSVESEDSAEPIDMSAFALPDLDIHDDEEDSPESSKEDFWLEDLVWPDQFNTFPGSSGIKPSVLTSKIESTPVDIELGAATRCQMALVVKRRPRPKELPWNVVVIKSDPPLVDEDELEEFLVHDPLFVEFFNAFLTLPSFPEPISFNVETGGFEVVSDDKQKLAQQIKEAVRSQHTMAKKYEVTRRHAFSDIPVIPIEDSNTPEAVKIDTSFKVITLNKDQGIYWIKAERLPIFLESDFYFQYRLAKVISQARIVNEEGEFVVMKIDFTSRPKKSKKSVEVPPPNLEEIIMKEMYISFGDVKGAAKEAWFTQAKQELKTEPTFTTLGSKVSAIQATPVTPAIKQKEKSSVFHSQYFGVYTPGLVGPNEYEPPINDDYSVNNRMFTRDRPFTPRPSDKIHSSTSMLRKKLSKDPEATEEMVPAGSVVFRWPKQDQQSTDAESGIGEMDEKDEEFEKRITAQPIIDQIYYDGSWESGGTGEIVLRNIDELGSVIVGAVIKKTIAEMLELDEKIVLADPAVSSIYPSMDLTCVSTDRLENLTVAKATTIPELEFEQETYNNQYEDDTSVDKQPVRIKWEKAMPKPAEEESDADSLLDSDEDFEERDIHFRRKKDKWHSLTSLKGIMAFKKFLEGTHGEKYWELWIDIDKGRLIKTEEEKQRYIMYMRERYYKKGSPFELSQEDKKKLGLENLASWCPKYLFQVHAKVLEPLVLYWAPRYLLKHLLRTHPEKYYLYNQMKSASPQKESDPFPHTQELLPLRPKSCCPRFRLGPGIEELQQDKNLSNLTNPQPDKYGTSPMVGNRRVYGEDTIKRLANTPTAKYLGLKPAAKPKMAKTLSIIAGHKSVSPFVKSDSPMYSQDYKSETNALAAPETKVEIYASAPIRLSPMVSPSLVSKNVIEGVVKEAISKQDFQSACLPRKISTAGDRIPCPSKPLGAILDKRPLSRPAGSPLGPVKVPKDLLTPMLKIMDTKGKGGKYKSVAESGESGYTFYRQDSQEASKVCPQPGEEPQEGVKYAEITDCDFMGSERMEFLLQALHHEQDAGHSFRKYIEKSERTNWINHLDFWEKVQEYRKLFYKDKLDLHLIAKQAKSIFAQCIVEGAPKGIGVSESIELTILDHLNPAYEDLFDEAEEYTLKVLFEAFQGYLSQDVKSYCKVERAEIMRRLETKNTYILNLQKKGIIKERSLTPDDPMEGYKDPVYDDSILQRVPAEFREWSLDKLVHNRIELEHFRQYLIENFAEIDLKCWMDIEAWRRTPHDDARKRDHRARDIKKNYLNKKYFFGPSSPAGKEGQNRVMELGGGWGKFLEDKPHSSTILESQKYVRDRLERKHLPLFLLSKAFQQRNIITEIPAEVGDEVTVSKKRRAQAVLKVIDDAEQNFYKLFKRAPPDYSQIENLLFPPIQRRSMSFRSSLVPRKSTGDSISKLEAARSRLPSSIGLPKIKTAEQGSKEDIPYVIVKETISTPAIMAAAQPPQKLLESKWISSAKEIFTFQRALMNPLTCQQFQKYVSLQGDQLENDILFWLEVQKYKEMHHTHTDEGMLQQKINAIINCFIDSSIPPSLQIDITPDMAERILEHKHERSPYIFREAQLAIFRMLLQHWQPFCDFRTNMESETKVLTTLERHRLIADEKEKLHREEVMLQREKERLLRIEMGLLSSEELAEDDDSEDRADSLQFSYAAYLEEQENLKRRLEEKFQETGAWEDWVEYQKALGNFDLENMRLITVADRAAQTIRGIPQYPGQPYDERPGFQDDPDVEPEAKEYDIEDYIMYRNYLNIEVPDIRKEFCRKTVFAQQSAAEQQRERERKKYVAEKLKGRDVAGTRESISRNISDRRITDAQLSPAALASETVISPDSEGPPKD